MARVRRDLSEQCGGRPTATERSLIDQAATLALHVALGERNAAEGTPLMGQFAELNTALATVLGQLDRGITPQREAR